MPTWNGRWRGTFGVAAYWSRRKNKCFITGRAGAATAWLQPTSTSPLALDQSRGFGRPGQMPFQVLQLIRESLPLK